MATEARIARWRRYNESEKGRAYQHTYREEHADELRAKAREYQEAHREERRVYYRTWRASEQGRQVRRRNSAEERASTPEKVAARSAVNVAIRQGRIKRQPCDLCGVQPTHAHHPFGYEPPMDMAVWWLCVEHHRGMHAA